MSSTSNSYHESVHFERMKTINNIWYNNNQRLASHHESSMNHLTYQYFRISKRVCCVVFFFFSGVAQFLSCRPIEEAPEKDIDDHIAAALGRKEPMEVVPASFLPPFPRLSQESREEKVRRPIRAFDVLGFKASLCSNDEIVLRCWACRERKRQEIAAFFASNTPLPSRNPPAKNDTFTCCFFVVAHSVAVQPVCLVWVSVANVAQFRS